MLSKLCKLIRLSPNCSKPRNAAFDTFTYHHMAGVLTAQSCLDWFAQEKAQSSANYCLGYDGTIGGCVDENNRPWTTSSRANDNRAITFELSNSKTGGDWLVSDATIEAAINLSVDICKRHGKNNVLWFADKDKTLAYKPKKNEVVVTVHHWFANTNCPGKYLESKLPYMVSEINKRLREGEKPVAKDPWYIADGTWQKAKELGLMDGTRPKDNVTRAELAAVVVRLYDKVKGGDK